MTAEAEAGASGWRSLCVIPARVASKRIPHKPMQRLGSESLLERGIRSAVEPRCFDAVVVSTGDEPIAAAARAAGLHVHERPQDLTADDTGAAEITIDACRQIERRLSFKANAVACLAPAYPFRTARSVRDAVARFRSEDANFLVSSHPTDPHDFHWALRKEGAWAELAFGNRYLADRMHLPPVLTPNGSIKLARPAALEERGFFFGERLIAYEIERREGWYVGDGFDLAVARCLAEGEVDHQAVQPPSAATT